MDKLKVGIAGFGIVGKRRKACIDINPYAEVIAVCDQNNDQMNDLSGNVKVLHDYSQLLKEELDIVFVCMPNDIAPKVTAASIKLGIHTFCEKPPGRFVEDIQQVIKIEKSKPKIKLMYGFNHRYHDSVVEAQKIIQSKKLGKVINLKGTYGKSKLITFNQPDWRTKRSIAGGGVLLDQGIHMVDLMRLFAGNFISVHSFVSNNFWKHDVEDNAYALMKTKNDIVGMLHSSATQWRHRFNLEINLERGSLILGGILSGTKSYGAETLSIIEADPDNDGGDPKEHTIQYNHDPSWDLEVKTFIDSIINNKRIVNGNSQDALETMKLVNAIYFADPKWRETYDIKDFLEK
mgnify:CR=1 FL=1|tara:strand:- start:10336 stop:11379 length:1044 start_codon:yes stop_codon:yes gene_type:complete